MINTVRIQGLKRIDNLVCKQLALIEDQALMKTSYMGTLWRVEWYGLVVTSVEG